MDLREKPGIIQRIGEFILRFRLVIVFILALVGGYFFAGWREFLTHILNVSELLGMRYAEGNFLSLWPFAVLLVVLLLPRFLLGGMQLGFSALGIFIALPLILFSLQSSDAVVLPVVLSYAVLSIILMVVVKKTWACMLLPMALSATTLVGSVLGMKFVNYPSYELSAFSVLMLAELLGFALLSGKELSLGSPKAGALIFAFKKTLLPAIISTVALAAFFILVGKDFTGMAVLKHSALALGGFLCTFLLGVSLFSFTPLSRLRAEKRSIQVPKSSGTKEKK